jgi:hypothetical protein
MKINRLCKLLLLFFLASVFHFNIFSETQNQKLLKIESNRWSTFQGRLSWDDAKLKCSSLGQRLPKIGEFKKAFVLNIFKDWESDNFFYWSSDEFDKGHAFVFSIFDANVSDEIHEFYASVRCIRK